MNPHTFSVIHLVAHKRHNIRLLAFPLILALAVGAAGCGEESRRVLGSNARALDIPVQVRISTWNIETVGAPGTLQYEAALDILRRIDADVAAINEVASIADVDYFFELASDSGFPYAAVPSYNPFGELRSGVMSKFPFASTPQFHTSAELSGDPNANDLTRLIVEVTVDVPDNLRDLTLFIEHWKSGTGNDNEFRRALESIRMSQAAAGLDPAIDCYVILGDVNEQIDSVPNFPDPFIEMPSGLPISFELGIDLQAELYGPGIRNNPFFYIEQEPSPGVVALDARQLDGSEITHPATNRRIDYIMASRTLAGAGPQAEVYDSADEGLPGGLPKAGSPLPVNTCADAADHLPVFADITVAAGNCFDDSDCSDGKTCNGVEICVAGVCQPGTAADCDDGIACTLDRCDSISDSCEHTPRDSVCDNGLYCDGSETCDSQQGCRTGTAVECDDGIGCTDDSCNETGDRCEHTPRASACDDGLYCNGAEYCDVQQGCRPGAEIRCDDGIACTQDGCDENGDRCEHYPRDSACDDGLFCDGVESCDLLQGCLPGTTIDCNDGIACTQDICNESEDICEHSARDSACDDGLFCNGSESCDQLQGCRPGNNPCPQLACDEAQDECRSCLSDADCDDGVACTEDVCNAANRCDRTPDNQICDNGLFCDGVEWCDPAGGCQAGVAVDCSLIDNECRQGQCDEEQRSCTSSPRPDGTGCDDGSLCTENDSCKAGHCNGELKDCTSLDDSCLVGVCDSESGSCRAEPVPDGQACEDGNQCSVQDTCREGICSAGVDVCGGQGCNCNHTGSTSSGAWMCLIAIVAAIRRRRSLRPAGQ